MKVNIYAMVMPRLEAFFLEEWLEHHFSLGVSHIYLYDNGFTSIHETPNGQGHRELTKEEENVKWTKKPDADYFLDYSDDQIMDKFNEVVSNFKKVTVVKWRHGIEHDYGHPYSQIHGYRHCDEKYGHITGYWYHTDPDEYLVLKEHDNICDLVKKYQKFTSILIEQKIFDKRERGKPVREIWNYGYEIEDFTKAIVRSPIRKENPVKTYYSIHRPESEKGKRCRAKREVAEIYHYRGHPSYAGGWKHVRDYMDSTFDKVDKTMMKYL